MKNRILSLLLVLCLLCTILPVPVVTAAGANGSFAGGTGTASDPYLVATKEHLDNVRQYPNGHFMQTVDIAFAESDFVEGGAFYNAGAGWLPIGSQTTPFSGTYHGNGYTISGLRSYGDNDYIGLFSYVDGGAVIRGVTLTGVSLQGTRYVGGIAACVNAEAGAVSISDCSVSGSLAGKSYVGGFIGIGRGTAGSLSVRNCVNRAGIDVYSNGDGCGGIAGGLSGATITRCVNYGAVDGVPFSEDRGTASLGGIVGHASDDAFLACANYGDVSTFFAGGIAGSGDDCSFSNCLNTGVLTHSDEGYGKAITSGSGNNSENCFVLGTESSIGNISHATAEQMQSGEVAYQMKDYFGQTLGEDTYPVLLNGANSVYQVKNCQGEVTYSNTGNDILHNFADNVCTACGAIGGLCGDNLTWTLKDGTLTISGTGPMWDFDDESFDYSDEPESPWYDYREEITDVVVEEGVTTIGTFAFLRCKYMETADVADSVTDFGSGAFKGCNALTAITIPEEQKYIGSFTFSGCNSLTGVIIPNGVADIGEHAFAGSGLTSVVIPNSVSRIYDRAFDSCTELETVEIGSGVSMLCERAFGFCPRLSSVKFLGAPPNAGVNNVFAKSPSQNNTTLFAYYPGWMDNWTELARKMISTAVVWKPYCQEHSWVDATCTEPKTCSVCGQTEGEATGHIYDKLTHQCVCGATAYQVAFDGYKGDNFGGMFQVNGSFDTRLFRQEECAAGATLSDTLTFTITKDPQWEGMTFEGWLRYEEEGIEQGGPFYLQNGDLYTTAEVMEHAVPDYNVRYVAKWAEIPMFYYENLYDPYWGVGGNNGDMFGVVIRPHDLTLDVNMTVMCNNQVIAPQADGYYFDLGEGETLRDLGFSIGDVSFYDDSREFLGWKACILEEGKGFTQIEGTSLMRTEEILDYPSLGSPRIWFYGQWSGEDADYFSDVAFDAFGGTQEIYVGESLLRTDRYFREYCREGGTVVDECSRYFDDTVSITNLVREGNVFGGWIEYTKVGDQWQMVSDQSIGTDVAFAKTVTENDMAFVAYWSNVPWEDYENYGSGGGEDGGSGEDGPNNGATGNVGVNGGTYCRFATTKNGEPWIGVSGRVNVEVPAGSSLRAEGYRFENWELYPYYEGETHTRIGWYVGNAVDENGKIIKLPGTGLLSDEEMLSYIIPADQKIIFEAQWDEEDNGGDVSAGGYVASITAAEEVTNGDRILALIKAKHSEETQFAAGEVVVSYDSSMLTFNQAASNLGNATVKDSNGRLILEDYGEDKSFNNTAYVLAFDTKGTGTVTLNLESAAFVNKENAVKSDLIEATLDPASAVVVISRSQYPVTLDGIFNGPATVTDGESYTFCAADTKHYVYDSVSVVMGGNSVGVTDNGDGSYTVERVNGPLTITGSRSERTFQVTFNGNGADKITDARPTATYGTEYVFDLPSEEGAVYTLEQFLIDGQVYTDYMVTGKTITIDGMHIHGDMVITVTRTVTEATVTVEGNGAGAAAGYDPKLELGKDYTLTLNPAAGYSYTVTATMNGEPAEVIDNGDNTYTIKKVTGDIVFTVTRKLVTDAVTVSQYLKVNGANVWMVKFAAEVEPGKMPTYDGKPMYWSDEYDAYCYLVITEILDEEEAKIKLDITDGTAPVLGDSMDVNGSGKVDASDAQLVYNMYNAMYNSFGGDVTVEKYLRADVNKDGEINVQDAAAIIAHILA